MQNQTTASRTCTVCGRDLSDARSIARGMGPTCARRAAGQYTIARPLVQPGDTLAAQIDRARDLIAGAERMVARGLAGRWVVEQRAAALEALLARQEVAA
jgi:hypothetical protein